MSRDFNTLAMIGFSTSTGHRMRCEAWYIVVRASLWKTRNLLVSDVYMIDIPKTSIGDPQCLL